MTYGVITDEVKSSLVKAHFYIPTLRVNTSFLSSHVYLKDTDFNEIAIRLAVKDIPENVSVVIDFLPTLTITETTNVLFKIQRKFLLLIPIIENDDFWISLRASTYNLYTTMVTIGLKYVDEVSEKCISRYKCLPYSAIILLQEPNLQANFEINHYSCFQVSSLLYKTSLPHLIVTESVALQQPFEFWHSLALPKLEKGMDMLIEPLQPLVQDMGLEVYRTFETDKIKYEQYDCAIEMAVVDLRVRKQNLSILVIGAGKGPLLKSVLKYTNQSDCISVVEKNAKCIQCLQKIVQSRPGVSIVCEDVRKLQDTDSYDLVISELLGSFGCNEACPEILQNFSKLKAVMIPQSYSSFICPIYSDLRLENIHRPYLINLSSSYAITESKQVFEFLHPMENRLNQSTTLEFKATNNNEVANALCGYFEAIVYGPYKIGNSPRLNDLEKCSSWFPIVFPIDETNFPLQVRILRESGEGLGYYWEVNGRSFGNDSQAYRVALS